MESKLLKILLHASAFFAPFLVPIIIYILTFFVDLEEHIKRLSIQALLFQLVMGVLIVISSILSFVIIGIPFVLFFAGMTIVVPIIGIVKAIQDKPYNYPIVGRWI